MNKKQKAQNNAIIDMSEELTCEQRQDVILNLLRQQKRYGENEPADVDNCTLIDLKKGVIAGSGICPVCNYWVARGDDYVDNFHENNEGSV
jgi:hypothetical protein